MAAVFIGLTVIAFVTVGAYLGYNMGFDNGFEAALECFEEEVENVQSNSDY